MKRSYTKIGVWHLGGRKSQTGGFLPILGTLAKPILVSTAGAIGGKVLEGIGKKYLGENNAFKKEEQKDIDMPRKGVQLPNGCIFFAKYERVNSHALAPTQVIIARTYVRKLGRMRQRIRQFGPRNKRKRRQQAGAALKIATAIDLGKRSAG